MELETIHVNADEAHDKWKQYVKAYKKHPSQMNRDLAAIYREAKYGHKIIDIGVVMKKAGVRTTNEIGLPWSVPNFAITHADSKKVHCTYNINGSVRYDNEHYNKAYSIYLPQGLDTYTWSDDKTWRSKNLTTAVPKIPPGVWGGKITNKHYILWHVDKWAMEPSADPFLLKRITKTLFTLLAQWDLTALELAVMKQYV